MQLASSHALRARSPLPPAPPWAPKPPRPGATRVGRLRLVGLALLLSAVCATPAHADWRRIQDVTRGTAQVLEKGELTFGVFAPIAYGITDSLTVQSSPIFDLLLMPNVTARYRVVRSRVLVMSVVGNYKQAWYDSNTDNRPGELDIGGSGSLYLGSRWALTGGLFFAGRFGATARGQFVGGVAVQAAAHFLATQRDLLTLTVLQRATADGLDRPLITAALVKQLRVIFKMHLVLGVSYGRFPLREGPVSEVPVWPVIDAWWRY